MLIISNKNLIPLPILKQNDFRFTFDSLLLTDQQTHHYVLIKDLRVFVNNIKGSSRSGSVICRNCFHICSSESIYERHMKSCIEHEAATIIMPDAAKNKLIFKIFQSKWFVPFVLYFDFEFFIKPVNSCSNSSGRISNIVEHYEPCGYCLVAVELKNSMQLSSIILSLPSLKLRGPINS